MPNYEQLLIFFPTIRNIFIGVKVAELRHFLQLFDFFWIFSGFSALKFQFLFGNPLSIRYNSLFSCFLHELFRKIIKNIKKKSEKAGKNQKVVENGAVQPPSPL